MSAPVALIGDWYSTRRSRIAIQVAGSDRLGRRVPEFIAQLALLITSSCDASTGSYVSLPGEGTSTGVMLRVESAGLYPAREFGNT